MIMEQATKGLIHIYTGDGKGKTTCALGLSVRAVGSGRKVYFLQFLKSWGSSEHNIKLEGLTMKTVEDKVKFVFNMDEEEKEENRRLNEQKFLEVTRLVEEEGYDMLVLDEIIGTIVMEQISLDTVVNFLKNKPERLEVVMTGRDAPKELTDLADYVSEIKKIKHPFDKGMPARKGIEF